MHDDQFKMLLAHRQLSWEGYRRVRKGVKRKIARHMRATGCDQRMQDYLEAVANDPLLEGECERLLAISISRFFRDRPMWAALKQWLSHRTLPACRVWIAGCACGEEVYSFKMVWDEMELAPDDKPRLSLMATDMNVDSIVRARAGRYPHSSLREVSPACCEAYFYPPVDSRYYQVRKWLKTDITWQRHNLQSNPPGNDYHLIFLRNSVLTYFRGSRRDNVLAGILKALTPGGALILGAKEKVPAQFAGRLQPGPHRNIFICCS